MFTRLTLSVNWKRNIFVGVSSRRENEYIISGLTLSVKLEKNIFVGVSGERENEYVISILMWLILYSIEEQ